MIVLAVDPGFEESAYVVWDGKTVREHDTVPNERLLGLCRHEMKQSGIVLVLEQVEAMGMAVGRSTFETVYWTGRFAEAYYPGRVERLPRRPIKLHLCGHSTAKDANIRQAIIDRFGPTKEEAIGRKTSKGPLYGLKGHEFAALAVALTWHDQNAGKPPELRPGTPAEW